MVELRNAPRTTANANVRDLHTIARLDAAFRAFSTLSSYTRRFTDRLPETGDIYCIDSTHN